jgi:lysophospholipid acyltransferase (LPLAT)-like uncharacterized protein
LKQAAEKLAQASTFTREPSSPAPRVKDRIAMAAARVGWSYLRAVGNKCVPLCVDHEGRALSPTERIRTLRLMPNNGRPVLVVYWIADVLTLAILPFCEPASRQLLRSVDVFVDATLEGHVTGRLIELLGGRYRMLQLPGHPGRLKQLHEVMAERASCALAVDGGGPYRQVGTGLPTLSSALGALIVPVAARASRTVTLAPRSRVRVPLPGCRVALAIGDALSVAREAPRRLAAEQVRDALDRLGAVADQVLRAAADSRSEGA